MSDGAKPAFTLKPGNGSLWENGRKERTARLVTLLGYVERCLKDGNENPNEDELDAIDACSHLKRMLDGAPDDDKPDLNGSLNVNGVEHWLDAWRCVTPRGKPYLRCKLGKPKQHQSAAPAAQSQSPTQSPQPQPEATQGDIPF